jgi:hypothetical protein
MNGDRQSDRRYFGAPQRKRTIFDYPLYAPGGGMLALGATLLAALMRETWRAKPGHPSPLGSCSLLVATTSRHNRFSRSA